MTKRFGTDGIRGRANVNLNSDDAYKIGRYLGYYFSKNVKGKIVVGKDTRLSGDMFESALAAGITASGCDVMLTGVCPTPMISYLTRDFDFNCGVMISASHNPYYDNGIKIFSPLGVKIDESFEAEIEKYLSGQEEIPFAEDELIGSVYKYEEGIALYSSYLKTNFSLDLTGKRIALDLANGSAVVTAKALLESMGATVSTIADQPDGFNINSGVGSTHPEALQEYMAKGNYDFGFAFDGDADRVMVFDENGNVLDGDYIIYLCAKYLKEQGHLNNDTVVTTVMANLGLHRALEAVGINTVKTQVGDKYVYESMELNDYNLGGEQSGHIIFKEYSASGDGLLTALKVLEVALAKNQSLSELTKDLFIYPQLLINTPVKNKDKVMSDNDINELVETIQDNLGDDGRILVRPSGTEPLIRVMCEASSSELCQQYVYEVIDKIRAMEE